MPLQFPSRDLTNQFISRSYQDVVQQYVPGGTASYFLDGLGNVILQIPSASVGGIVLTQDQSASYALRALSASYAPSSPSISSSYALSSSYSLTSTLADVALIADQALTAVSASWATSSLSASYAGTASMAFTASSLNFKPLNVISASFASSSLSASIALSANNANVIIIHSNGTNTLYTASANTDLARGAALVGAHTNAVSGDTIYVCGTYNITSSLGKHGVNWWFTPGATILRTDDSVGNIFDDGGQDMSYVIGGVGNFKRVLSNAYEASDPGDTGIYKQTGTGSVNLNFDSIVLDDSSTGESCTGIFMAAGTLYSNGNLMWGTGSANGKALYWWENGEANGKITSISSSNAIGIYCDVNSAPTGDLRLYLNKISVGRDTASQITHTILNNSGNANSAAWFFVNTTEGYIQTNGGKTYLIANKHIGQINVINTSKLYLKLQKLGGDFPATTDYIRLAGSFSWIDIDQIEPGLNSRACISASLGTHFFTGKDIVASGSDAIVIGGTVDPVTLNILGGKITTDNGRVDLKNISGIGSSSLNVGVGLVYNSFKTSGSITPLPIFGNRELIGISNLNSGSTGIIKRTGQGVYAIATASVDYVSPSGSLFGTASWANNAISSSYAGTASVLLGSVVSASYSSTSSVAINALTASSINFKPLNVISASWASSSLSASTSILALNAITASFASSSLTASTAITANNSNVIVVHGDGTKTLYTASANTDASRGEALINAFTHSVSGDTIYVDGNYNITSSLGKNGVNWWFAPGATIFRSDDTVGNIFDDVGTNMSFSVGGHGNFHRFISDQVELSDPGDSGVFKQTGVSEIDFHFNSLTLTDNSTGESGTTLFVAAGTCRANGNKLYLSGSSAGAAGMWWENGEVNATITEIISDGPPTFLIYNHVNANPTGDFRLYTNRIDIDASNTGSVPAGRNAIDNNVSDPNGAAWVFANTIRGTINSAGGKLYIIANKIIGTVILSGGLNYVTSQKVGGSLSLSAPYFYLAGGTSWLDVGQFEPGSNSRECISASFGTHFISCKDITSSGSDAVSIGGLLSATTINLLSGIISSSGAGKVDLKRINGTLNVGSAVVFNSFKTSGSITPLSVFGNRELIGISNLNSGSTGIVKRTGQGVYAIATASVDYVSPTGSLFGTASWATNALTASSINFTPLSATSSSFASSSLTASFVTASNVVGVVNSASYALQSSTASFVTASNVVGVVASSSYVTTLRATGSQGELLFNSSSLQASTSSVKFISQNNTFAISGSTFKVQSSNTGSFLVIDPNNIGSQDAGIQIIKRSGTPAGGCLMTLNGGGDAPYIYIHNNGSSYGIFGTNTGYALFQHAGGDYFRIETSGGGLGALATELMGVGEINLGANSSQLAITNNIGFIMELNNGDDSTSPGNPATPAGWQHVFIDGTEAWIPYYR